MRILICMALALLVVACVPAPAGDAVLNVTNGSTVAPEAPAPQEPAPAPEVPVERAPAYTVTFTEGDLVQLKPEAIDPDGDKIMYTFTKPFDTQGRWQTRIGDEGTYAVVVGASDSKSTTTETVRVVISRANRPPVIDCTDFSVDEGGLIDLHKRCTITDEDDRDVVVTYGGWMTSWRYLTKYDDAGVHTVTITASDKRKEQILHTVKEDVTVTVKNTNRAPTFDDSFPARIVAVENDVITLPGNLVEDPDGDKITYTFSPPFDKQGVWKTKLGDAGSYDIDVVASDGSLTVKRTVNVKIGMLNTAPVLKFIPDIAVKEGETVKLGINAYDREGDKLTVVVSGWMTGETYKTTYDDAGEYTVSVFVKDGVFNASQVVHVTVTDQNRPPTFVVPA